MIIHIGIWICDLPTAQKKILDNINQVKLVVIDQATEFTINHLQGNSLIERHDIKVIVELCKTHNIPVIITTSNATDDDFYNKASWDLNYAKLIDYPASWISRHAYDVFWGGNNENKLLGMDLYNNNVCINDEVKHLYITMNNRGRYHRSKLMDTLAQYKLIDNGAIAFRDTYPGNDNNRNDILDSVRNGWFTYKYWDNPRRLTLDQEHTKYSTPRQNILPVHYKHSFCQIVTETTVDQFYISEKTATPLLFNKIFLVVGSKNFHKKLVEVLGFKMFDSLFDYSFDSCDKIEDRIEGIVKNIEKYKNYSFDELKDLQNSVLDIVKYNRKLALDYVQDKIPQDIIDINNELYKAGGGLLIGGLLQFKKGLYN